MTRGAGGTSVETGSSAGGAAIRRAEEHAHHREDGRTAHHPQRTKAKLIARLHRIEGQVRGIARMVDEDVYCDHVLNQITAVEAALNGARKELLEAHIRSCVVQQIHDGELSVVDELMKTIAKMMR